MGVCSIKHGVWFDCQSRYCDKGMIFPVYYAWFAKKNRKSVNEIFAIGGYRQLFPMLRWTQHTTLNTCDRKTIGKVKKKVFKKIDVRALRVKTGYYELFGIGCASTITTNGL